MHEMLAIATDVLVCQFVCLSRGFTRIWCAKTAELIEVVCSDDSWGPKERCVRRGSRNPNPSRRGEGKAHLMHPLPNCFGFVFIS